MEAKEFIKELKRLSEFVEEDCEKCPLDCKCFVKCCFLDDFINYDAKECEEIVNVIENWAKEHPKRTYKDVFLEKFPDAIILEDGRPHGCVGYTFGREHYPTGSEPGCGISCVKCWNRQYEED